MDPLIQIQTLKVGVTRSFESSKSSDNLLIDYEKLCKTGDGCVLFLTFYRPLPVLLANRIIFLSGI